MSAVTAGINRLGGRIMRLCFWFSGIEAVFTYEQCMVCMLFFLSPQQLAVLGPLSPNRGRGSVPPALLTAGAAPEPRTSAHAEMASTGLTVTRRILPAPVSTGDTIVKHAGTHIYTDIHTSTHTHTHTHPTHIHAYTHTDTG